MRMDDIVFEHRNKEYGAYVLRQKYMRTVMFSMACAVALFLLFIYFAFEYFNSGSKKDVKYVTMDLTYIGDPNEQNKNDEPPPHADSYSPPKGMKDDQNYVVTDTIKKIEIIKGEEGLKTDTGKVVAAGTADGNGNGKPFAFAEVMPRFPGGDAALQEFLDNNIKYPLDALRKRIEGTVMVNFVVNESGEIENITIIKGINPQLDKECVRVIKNMPRWIPGRQRGRPVNVYFTLPVKFSLN